MSDIKKFTAKEAAQAVLKRAKELVLAKSEVLAKAKVDKSEDNPDEKQDAKLGEQVENAVHEHEGSAEHPGQHEEKGYIKLAKFMGRRDHKREQKGREMDKAETGYEKGVAFATGTKQLKGVSVSGQDVRAAHDLRTKGATPGVTNPEKVARAREDGAKKASVGRMEEQKKIQPKLDKSEVPPAPPKKSSVNHMSGKGPEILEQGSKKTNFFNGNIVSGEKDKAAAKKVKK